MAILAQDNMEIEGLEGLEDFEIEQPDGN